MTYQKFKDIEYNVNKEKDFYSSVIACFKPKKEEEAKYENYKRRAEKIAKFKEEVITKALKNIPEHYFD